VGERTTLTAGYLGTISRLLDDPLGLIIVSRSGAGKSSVQDLLCDVVPDEDLVRYTRLTGQALFYKEEDALVHKVLAIDEEAGAAEAAYSIRNLQSAQVLTVAATRADPQTGKLRTEEYRVGGPVFIMFTTTSPEALDYETRNRFVQVGIDESKEQTRKILVRQREADTLEGVLRREEASVIRRVHQNAQRLLRPVAKNSILSRSPRRLRKANRCPDSGSCSSTSWVSAARPSKPRRKSTGEVARNTRTLAGTENISEPGAPAGPRRSPAARAR
jgi:hypothetical protein